MRKAFAAIFWVLVTLLYICNIAILAYLICRSFHLVDFSGWEWLSWANQRGLFWLWLIYLFGCIPVVALLQYYGKNLRNENISLPLVHTVFGVFVGLLKVILTIAVLSALVFLTVDVIIPLIQRHAESGEWNTEEIFGELRDGSVHEAQAIEKSVREILNK